MAALILKEGEVTYLISTANGTMWKKHKAQTNVRYDKSTNLKWIDDNYGGYFFCEFRVENMSTTWISKDCISWKTNEIFHYF